MGTNARWIKNNARRTSETVLRLYWPCANTNCNPDTPGPCNLPGTGPELADIYYDLIVDKAVRRFGIRNFQILNELNLEYEPTCGTRTIIGGYMYNVAYHLKRRAVQAGTYPIYLGFPGSGGSKFSDPNWGPYWNDYKTFITRPLDFVADFAYNWLAVHVYGISEAECEQNLIGAYDDLRVRIPQYPHRYTEWSIPNDVPNRAAAMASALRGFRNHVLNQNDVDVYALHAYISRISDPGSGGDRYGLTPGGGGQVAGVF